MNILVVVFIVTCFFVSVKFLFHRGLHLKIKTRFKKHFFIYFNQIHVLLTHVSMVVDANEQEALPILVSVEWGTLATTAI